LLLLKTSVALNGLYGADVHLRNYSLTEETNFSRVWLHSHRHKYETESELWIPEKLVRVECSKSIIQSQTLVIWSPFKIWWNGLNVVHKFVHYHRYVAVSVDSYGGQYYVTSLL